MFEWLKIDLILVTFDQRFIWYLAKSEQGIDIMCNII